MTNVNPQITDAAAPPSAPPVKFDEALEQTLARAANDAVTAQQQFYVLAQAATTQSVATMLSIDTSATAVQVKKDVDDATAAVKAQASAVSAEAVPSHGDDDLRLAALAREMRALGEAYCGNLMRVVQLAATSACMTAMIARPERFDQYEPVLEAIENLV